MKEENVRQVRALLKTANKAWNYSYESLERLYFKPLLSDSDKGYSFFIRRRLKEIKALLVNFDSVIGNEEVIPSLLEKNLCKRLTILIEEMKKISLSLDDIYLK